MIVRIGGAFKTVVGGAVYDSSAWRPLSRIRIYVDDGWKEGPAFAPDMSFSISPDNIGQYTFQAGEFETEPATAMVEGGRAPFNYIWERLSGDDDIEPTSLNSATTTFRVDSSPNSTHEAAFRCTVTDVFGTSATAEIIVRVNFISFQGGFY